MQEAAAMRRQLYKVRRRDKTGKLKEGRMWRARYRIKGDARTTDVSLGVTDKRVAEKQLDLMISEAERERAGILPPRRVRDAAAKVLSEHLRDYVADLGAKGCNREYIKRVEQRATRLFGTFGWRGLRDVDPEAFVQWRILQASLAPKTLNDHLATLVGLFNWMKRLGRTEHNPFSSVARIDMRGKAKAQRRALTLEELGRLRAVVGERWPAYLTAAKTGLRRGELRQLEWQDVCLDGDRPFLRLRAATTKNRRGSDHPLEDEVAAALRSWQQLGVKARERVFWRRLPRRETRQERLPGSGHCRAR